MSFVVALLMGRGLSSLAAKAIVYAVLAAIVGGALLGIRQHYVNLGWHKAIAAVKKQDDRAVAAADKVQATTAKCDETNGFWDVITQNCKLQDGDEK
jgi:hypothetical protein